MHSVFASSPVGIVGGVVFTALLVAACWTDIRERRIPNRLTLALALGGLVFAAVTVPFGIGMLGGVLSLALGFALWIPLYALGLMGAGDVKLFAAAAAWLAPLVVLQAALLSALAGGVLALVWMLRTYGGTLVAARLSHAISNPSVLREADTGPTKFAKLPYGVAMFIGLTLSAWLPRFLF